MALTLVSTNRLQVLAHEIRAAHEAVKEAQRTAVAKARDAGLMLIEAKRLIGHGNWMRWLADNVAISDRSVRAYMQIAQLSDAELAGTANLTLEALLAAIAIPRHSDPPAQRGQPSREGPDFWPTPICLTMALQRFVLPELPPGPLWEPAAGDGRLVRSMMTTGRRVYASDLYPQDGSEPCDFLIGASPPDPGLIAATNPPFNSSDAFLARGLQLLDQGRIAGLVLLLRHDHLQAAGRVEAFNRCTREIHCNWRPRWIPDSEGNPRWSFSWLAWLDGPRQAPFYLSEDDVR